MELHLEKSELLASLGAGIVTVVFTKKDGTARTMKCTRNMTLVESEHHPKSSTEDETDNVRVFDLENQGWRSFNFTSITQITL